MNNKITIIDLYKKIVMKEKLPKKVKYENKIFNYEGEIELNPYVYKREKEWEEYLIGSNLYRCPADTVEIIEEEKEIEKLDLKYDDIGIDFKKQLLTYCDNLQYKINELIDVVNELKK